jgi:hypothetical protein
MRDKTAGEGEAKLTIDERIERLTARHEALAQSVEMLRDTVHGTSTPSTRWAAPSTRWADRWRKLLGKDGMMEKLLGAMRTLAETFANHERRIGRLEG